MTRIAMWSGPRNISTALMRSWGSRSDCFVSDEPLYAHYLSEIDEDKRREHPASGEVMRSQPTDWHEVAAYLTGPVPHGKPVWYQKHMAHHLTSKIEHEWIFKLTNAFLLRDPARMVVSFNKVIPNPRPEDLGLPQQLELFERIFTTTGEIPAVIDSDAVLANPEKMLNTLCEYLRVPFDRGMLSWPPGARDTDGVWAPHWYERVNQSTGFGPPASDPIDPPKHLHAVIHECTAIEAELLKYALRPFTPGWIERIREAQSFTHIRFQDGVVLERVRYGSEQDDYGSNNKRCGDCGVAQSQFHVNGCDVDRCPRCKEQAISCDCECELIESTNS